MRKKTGEPEDGAALCFLQVSLNQWAILAGMWHHHAAEDGMFTVTKDELHMKWRDAEGQEHDGPIRPGEFIIVPHGTEHMPYTLEETHVILFEPATTLNTCRMSAR